MVFLSKGRLYVANTPSAFNIKNIHLIKQHED